MHVRLHLVRAASVGLIILLPFATQIACKKAADSQGTAGGAPSSGNGPAVFTANCAKCHSINGTGAKRAPDLTHVGGDSEHTEAWLTEFIKNPSSKKPGSRMPPFDGKISDADLKGLTDYLVSLK